MRMRNYAKVLLVMVFFLCMTLCDTVSYGAGAHELFEVLGKENREVRREKNYRVYQLKNVESFKGTQGRKIREVYYVIFQQKQRLEKPSAEETTSPKLFHVTRTLSCLYNGEKLASELTNQSTSGKVVLSKSFSKDYVNNYQTNTNISEDRLSAQLGFPVGKMFRADGVVPIEVPSAERRLVECYPLANHYEFNTLDQQGKIGYGEANEIIGVCMIVY